VRRLGKHLFQQCGIQHPISPEHQLFATGLLHAHGQLGGQGAKTLCCIV